MATISWPLASFTITQEFHSGHTGIDLAAPSGTPIYATDDGIVHASGDGANNSWMGSIAGLYVLIRHSWGYSGYAHMSSYVVSAGTPVVRGQLIGYVGATGLATGPHCHFETLPLSPNWSVVSGRVNPRTHTIIPYAAIIPPTTPKPPTEEEDDMPKNSGTYYTETSSGKIIFVVSNLGSGFYHLISDGRSGVMLPTDLQKRLVAAYELAGTGFFLTTENEAKALGTSCAKVRAGTA